MSSPNASVKKKRCGRPGFSALVGVITNKLNKMNESTICFCQKVPKNNKDVPDFHNASQKNRDNPFQWHINLLYPLSLPLLVLSPTG